MAAAVLALVRWTKIAVDECLKLEKKRKTRSVLERHDHHPSFPFFEIIIFNAN